MTREATLHRRLDARDRSERRNREDWQRVRRLVAEARFASSRHSVDATLAQIDRIAEGRAR